MIDFKNHLDQYSGLEDLEKSMKKFDESAKLAVDEIANVSLKDKTSTDEFVQKLQTVQNEIDNFSEDCVNLSSEIIKTRSEIKDVGSLHDHLGRIEFNRFVDDTCNHTIFSIKGRTAINTEANSQLSINKPAR